MEVENFDQELRSKLQEKAQDNPTYRKAYGVLQSLMEAAAQIPNFSQSIAATHKTLAFYITAGTYKLLKKVMEGDSKHEHQLDAYLLLLSMTLPQSSSDALVQGGILRQLRKYTLMILKKKDLTPLMTRLTVSILSHSFAPQMTTTNFHKGEDKQILLELFDRSVASPRSNALSRQCSRLLTHLLKNNSTVSATIAEEAKANLLSTLEDRKQLYLSNIKQVMIELPVRLLNDICYKVASNLTDIDSSDPSQEQILSQTYFFLEKMSSKLLASTLEDMILILINSVPAGTMPEKVQLSFLQLLYEFTIALVHISQESCNKILSPVISVLMEMLVINQKTSKFANNQLSFIISNCIRSSLWRHNKRDELSLQNMGLEEERRQFTKVVGLFQGLLSSRFPDSKLAANLISLFFNQLQQDAFEESLSLIHKVVEYRSEFDDKKFRKIMESIILAFGVQKIIKIYPLSLNGDIGSQNFEEENNLWMLTCIEKTERAEKMSVFDYYLSPLLQKARILSNQMTSKQRQEAYRLIEELLWRCMRPFTKIIDSNVNYEKVLGVIEGELNKVTDTTLNQLAQALEHLSQILVAQNYKSKGAELLIKALAGILDIHAGSAKQILKAIQGLSKIASPDYVKRVFDKNIEKLISLGEEKSLHKEEDKNLKNLQILMAVNSAIDLRDPSVTTKFKISREELLLRLVSCLINSTGTFQKKGYKYISETLSASPKSLYLQILQLFEGNIKVENGSKYYRLSVIGKLWSWLKTGGIQENLQHLITFIKNHLPQILLSLREQNKGARQESIRLIGEFSNTMEELDLLQSFIETVCAGLVGERSQMKLATLSCLSTIIIKSNCTQATFKQILEIVLLLLQQKKQELYKGVVEYCKKSILSLPIDKQKELLPIVLKLLFEEDEEGKMENRSILRHFLIKLAKKHGKEVLELMIPQAHRKMCTHAIKMENREKKKKKELKIKRAQQLEEQKAQQKNQEQSSSSEQEAEVGHQNEMQVQQPLQELDNTNNLLLKYDLDKEQFHFQPEQRGKSIIQKKDNKPSNDDITFDDRGIMIIQQRKRPRNQDEEEPEEQPVKPIEQPLNFKKKKQVQIHQVKESGTTFKTNRAGGDVKLKDKPQPYAFIQFNSKALNKRFKKQAEKVFDTLFEKKQGGLRGLKSRIAGKH